MFIKLNKINKTHSGEFYLSEVRINPAKILFISENDQIKVAMMEGKTQLGLNSVARFSDLSFAFDSGSETITVVGDPALIEAKILSSNRQLLRG